MQKFKKMVGAERFEPTHRDPRHLRTCRCPDWWGGGVAHRDPGGLVHPPPLVPSCGVGKIPGWVAGTFPRRSLHTQRPISCFGPGRLTTGNCGATRGRPCLEF